VQVDLVLEAGEDLVAALPPASRIEGLRRSVRPGRDVTAMNAR
jgi:hypothetical protein